MRDIDWSAIPFDDLPPWHLDWDVDQRENATYPATTSITAMRPVKPKKYQATDLIAHLKAIGGVFTGSKDTLAHEVWPRKTPAGRTVLRLLTELSDNGDAVVINRGRCGVEVILTPKNRAQTPELSAPKQMHCQKLRPSECVILRLNGIEF